MIWRIALSLLVAAVFLTVLVVSGGVDAHDVERTWGALTWRSYAIATALHAFVYVLRAVRFRMLLPPGERPDFRALSAVNAAYTMAAFVLPAKLGEASFVLYANRVWGARPASALAALVLARVLDLATLAGGFSLACFLLGASGAHADLPWLTPLGAGLAAVALVCFFLAARGDLVVRIAAALVRALGLGRLALGRALLERSTQIGAGLRLAGGDGRLAAATLLSIPVWLAIFLFCAVLARGLGLSETITFPQATFGASLAIVTSLVPVSAFASFGTLEAGWVLGFGALGVPRDLAAATGLGLHVVQLVNVIALGLLGHVAMAAWTRRLRSTP